MSSELHAIERAIRAAAIDGVVALERRREMLGVDALGEIVHQFQIPISGTAADLIGWTDQDLVFDVEFYNVPEQRDSPFTVPTFTYGAVLDVGDDTDLVMVTAVVKSWRYDDGGRDAIVGATVSIGVLCPGLQQAFSGYVHLSFQGYGAPAENNPELDVGT